MTPSLAVEIIKNFGGEYEFDDLIDAWQCLIDTGIVWQLQGWYGRNAVQMIEDGHCTPPAK